MLLDFIDKCLRALLQI